MSNRYAQPPFREANRRTSSNGFYDTQYKDRTEPDCRGRLRSDKDGKFAYRAVVPVAYPIPGDVRGLYL